MNLLIDDFLNANCDVIARTPQAGLLLLEKMEWDSLFIDHNLGTEMTGYDVLEKALENKRLPNQVKLLPTDTSSRMRMRIPLENAGYVTVDGLLFIKPE